MEKAAINIVCTNKLRAGMNMLYHVKLPGQEIKVEAVTWMATQKSYKPAPKPDGTIEKTGFMKDLRLKLCAKVMMIKNVRTADSLTKGQLGFFTGVLKDKEGGVSVLMVKFDKEDAGKLTRRENPQLEERFPGSTKVEKIQVTFSLANNSAAKANLIQFPIVLAHAVLCPQDAGSHSAQTFHCQH